MTYSNDLISKIILNIKNKKYTDTEIIQIFDISRKTYYNIKKNMNTYKANSKRTTKRKSKITKPIINYVSNYVLRKVNFDCNKLISLINKNYGVRLSKFSIYKILKDNNIKKKKFIINWS